MDSSKYKYVEYQFALSNEETQHFKRVYNLLEQMICYIEEDEQSEEGEIVIDFAGFTSKVSYNMLTAIYSYLHDLI